MVCYPSCIRHARLFLACLFLCSRVADVDLAQSQSSQEIRSLDRIESANPAFSDESAQERITALRSEIARHDDLYFKQASPEISDLEYDRLKEELQNLERSYPEITARLGYRLEIGDDRSDGFQTAQHGTPMLSLRKAYSQSALQRFHSQVTEAIGADTVTYLIEPKVDGIAISLTYEQGRLVRALTRGNGREGDDITANILTIPSIPRILHRTANDGTPILIPDKIEVRGEVFSTFSNFDLINNQRKASGETSFAHPRNLAAGSAKLTDPNQVAQRNLSALFFGYGVFTPLAIAPKTQQEFYELAQSWGMPVLRSAQTATGFDALSNTIASQNAARSQLPFPTDGLVVKVNSLARQRLLGNSEQAPRWALAYKFSLEQTETRLISISIQVGRTGQLTPIAELEPVFLSGSLIQRATLHNESFITKMDLRIGDTVIVEMAGEIIPKITGVNRSKRPTSSLAYPLPDHCPSCAATLQRSADRTHARCLNTDCPAQLQRRIEHYASRQCMNIEGLGPATINELITHGWVTSLPDLYQLDQTKLLSLGKDLNVSTNKLLKAIEGSKHAELWRVIFGLSIPGIGKSRAQTIANAFGSLAALAEVSHPDFVYTDSLHSNLNPTTRQALQSYASKPENQRLIRELIRAGVTSLKESPSSETSPKPFSGKSFVLTGKLPTLTRQQAIVLIENAGGIVRARPSKKTDYLIVGSDPSAKLEEALDFNITTIEEADLLRMHGNADSMRYSRTLDTKQAK